MSKTSPRQIICLYVWQHVYMSCCKVVGISGLHCQDAPARISLKYSNIKYISVSLCFVIIGHLQIHFSGLKAQPLGRRVVQVQVVSFIVLCLQLGIWILVALSHSLSLSLSLSLCLSLSLSLSLFNFSHIDLSHTSQLHSIENNTFCLLTILI